jgi:hypothetical protein
MRISLLLTKSIAAKPTSRCGLVLGAESLAFQNEDLQEPMSADEKAMQAVALHRETNTMTEAFGNM